MGSCPMFSMKNVRISMIQVQYSLYFFCFFPCNDFPKTTGPLRALNLQTFGLSEKEKKESKERGEKEKGRREEKRKEGGSKDKEEKKEGRERRKKTQRILEQGIMVK